MNASLQQKSITAGRFTLIASRAYPNNRIVWHVFNKQPGSNMGPGMTKAETRRFLAEYL